MFLAGQGAGGLSSLGAAWSLRRSLIKLFILGMEALETAISYWEDAMAAYSTARIDGILTVTSVEDAEFSRELQKVIDLAYALQEESELLFLDQVYKIHKGG